MPRISRLAAAFCALVVGSAVLASCASTSHGVDVSAPWGASTPAPANKPLMLVFGDSWTHGLAATSPSKAYAPLTGELLGWNVEVDGENGSGYLRPGEQGGFYGTRVAELDPALDPDVVVIQGSINDRAQPLSALPRAARAVWRAVEHTYPNAALVVLGPAPNVMPLDPRLEGIDDALAALARTEHVDYISPIAENWITADNVSGLIDPSAASHPSDAGHAYLARRLADDLKALDPLSLFAD